MKPQRPYLLRALYEWLVDSDEVPYVLVDATVDGVQVPAEHVEDGQIVLNLGPNAVRDLVIEDEFVMCSSRFGGRAFELILPMHALRAIYGRDSGLGMVFPEDPGAATAATPEDATAAAQDQPKDDKADGKPTLKLV